MASKIEERLEKLLALTQSPNEFEAMKAAKAAQELMAKYNIQLSNLKHEQKSVNGVTSMYGKRYRFQLAKIVADNYGVKHYYINKMTVAFYGHAASVETAVKVYDYLHNMIHRLADSHQTKVWKKEHCTKGVYNSYVQGFLNGLKAELDSQCKALAIVVPPDVEEAYKEFSKDFTSFRSKGELVEVPNFDSYKQGEEAGKKAAAKENKQIEK